ncbi:hypothetical protein D9756_006061 [Leucocoprinus leucothites]|uniref:Uncharacterized protein n=1 Tax=Leucocoprinus leucothites TaxID=201217 RepID=A0A8H5FXN7_9AGAR|nr:hypothetical protein D9756_006061 [Leucoagaricus leucothites]
MMYMGLGKTITCVSLIAATLQSAKSFAAQPLEQPQQPPKKPQHPNAAQFAGAVWGMPESPTPSSNKDLKAKKAEREQEKADAEYVRACRIKARSRATLIICPLSTVANWEDQFREHWRGEVTVVGGNGICPGSATTAATATTSSTNGTNTPDSTPADPTTGAATPSQSSSSSASTSTAHAHTAKPDKSLRVRDGTPMRVYIYHGNARRPDPTFLADFDAVITTYATLASEFSKQNRTAQSQTEEGDGGGSSDGGIDRGRMGGVGGGGADPDLEIVEVQTGGMSLEPTKPAAKKTGGTKRKKPMTTVSNTEIASPLQSIHWFRVVLDEAHSIKEIQTVGCRASCDLIADRRLCLTGTPVQNKLDDMFALIKFLRLTPFDDKNVWTKHISAPAKFGQREGIIRLRTVMDTITLRRTKESRTPDGRPILALPPREDKLVRLEMSQSEMEIYNQYFTESKAEFTDLSRKNQVMKNYVGILQKLLRLRQICDHRDLLDASKANATIGIAGMSYEDVVDKIAKEGINRERASAIFAILREAMTTQCTECGEELGSIAEGAAATTNDGGATFSASTMDGPPPSKRGRKSKGQTSSRAPTRASSPSSTPTMAAATAGPRTILTRCQHLFCIECFRSSICPGWPDMPSGSTTIRQCSTCQTELVVPTDVVEIKPDMIVDASAGGGEGKKAKKETKEDRMKKLEKRVQEIEMMLVQEQQAHAQAQTQTQTQTHVQAQQVQAHAEYYPTPRPTQQQQEGDGFKQEMDVAEHGLGGFMQETDVNSVMGEGFALDEMEHGQTFSQDQDFAPAFEHYRQEMDIKFDLGQSPPLTTFHSPPYLNDETATATGSGSGLAPEQFKREEEMKLEMDVFSDSSLLGLPPLAPPPPPYHQPPLPNVTPREQATLILQREICEKSTKIKALIQRLLPLSVENPHSENYNPAGLDVQIVDRDGNGSTENVTKTVVFSQWTSMLDKIEDALLIHKIRYDRLDGTMKREDRSKALDALKYDPGCEVLLVSLKAGGVGLNLTAAQRVILMDPCWNPAVENQAVDRIHRLGQTKPVFSTKFIISQSIEESMLKIQARKNRLADLTLGTRTKAEILEQRMEELKELFK